MGTRSAIVVKLEDGSYRGIYCHWDGYPSHHGPLLTEHYNTQESAEALVNLGFLSSLNARLRPNPGERHSYDNPAEGVTIARLDMSNPDHTTPINAKRLGTILKNIDWAYSYLFTDGEWTVNDGGDSRIELSSFRTADGKWEDEPQG